jgi:hypothetical protein
MCRLGVNLSADEFKLFLHRLDVDASKAVTFDEFARAFKGDDPIPDELYVQRNTEAMGKPTSAPLQRHCYTCLRVY